MSRAVKWGMARWATMRVAMGLHRIIGGMGQLAYKTNMRMD